MQWFSRITHLLLRRINFTEPKKKREKVARKMTAILKRHCHKNSNDVTFSTNFGTVEYCGIQRAQYLFFTERKSSKSKYISHARAKQAIECGRSFRGRSTEKKSYNFLTTSCFIFQQLIILEQLTNHEKTGSTQKWLKRKVVPLVNKCFTTEIHSKLMSDWGLCEFPLPRQ